MTLGSREPYLSYVGAGGPDTVYTPVFELEECEGLTLDRVQFGDLAIVPERWSLDRGTGNPMSLTVLASLDADQHQRFEQRPGTEIQGCGTVPYGPQRR